MKFDLVLKRFKIIIMIRPLEAIIELENITPVILISFENFNVGILSDLDEQILFQLGIMLVTFKPYIFVPV